MSSSLNSTLDSMEACSSEWRANSEVYISADGACTHNDMLNGLCKASPCEEEASLPTEPVPSSRHASTIMESNHVSDMSNINTNTINISVKNDHIVTSESTLVELSPQSRLSVSLHDRAVDGSENENDNQTADEENDNEENYCADEESESEVAEVTQTRAPSTHVVFGPPGEAGDTSPIAANSTDPMEEQPVDHVFSNYFRLSPESSKQRWVSNYHHASLALDSGRLLSHAIGVVGAYDAAAETTTTTATTTAAGGSGVAPWRQPSDTLQGWSEMCSGGCSLRRNVTGSHILLITEENTVLEEPMLSASCANCLLLRSTLCLPHGRSEACFSAQLQPQRCSSTKSATGSGQASLTYLGMGFTARVNEELRGFHMVLAQLHWDGTATVSVGVWRVTERDAVVELRVVCPPQLVRLSHDRLQLRLVAREGEFDVFVNEKRLSDAAVSMPGLRLKEARALLFNTGGAVAVRNIALSQGDRPPESRVFASPMYNNNSNNSNNCSNLNVSFISSSNVQVGAKCESPEHTHTLSPGSNNNSNNNNNNSSNNVSRTLSRNSSQPHACGNSSSTMNWCASRKTRPIAVGAPGICRNSPSRLCTPGNSPPTRMSAQNLAGLQRSMSGGSRAVSLGAKKHSDPCSLMHGPLIGSSVTELGSAVCRPSTCDVGAPLRECFSGVVSSPAVTMPRRGTQPPPPSRPSVSGGLPEGRGESAGGPGDVLHRSPTHTRRSSIGGTSVGGSATAALSQNSPQRSVERAAVPHARHRGRAAEAECTDANTVQDTRHRPASSLRSPAPNENHSARMTGSGQQASTHTTNNSPSCKPHPARSCSRLSPPLSSQHAHNNTTTNNNNGDDNNNKQQRHASKSAAAAPSRRSGAARSSPLPRRSQDTSDVLPAHIDPALAAVIRAEIMERSPQVSWDDIAGIADAKRLLKEAVLLPIMLPELFVGVVQPWRGVLLYGPPGTGKTMLAKAVATSANTTFFSISASTLNTKHYGESEKLVRTLFQLARHYAPSTIFFDEVDALASARGGNEHEASRRVKSEMLQQMDGLHDHDNASSNNSSNSRSVQRSSAGSTLGRGSGAGSGVSSRNSPVRATYQTHGVNNNNNKNELLTPEMDGSALPLPRSQPLSAPQEQQNQRVLVLATTNRPWDLDEAIRRRLEKRIYIPLPDAVSRRAMLDRYVTHLRLADDVVMDRVVEQTEGYSGADVAIVVRDAAMMPVRRLIDAYSTEEIAQLKAKGCLHVSEVCMADFDAALSRAQSSVAKESLKQFEQWTASFGST